MDSVQVLYTEVESFPAVAAAGGLYRTSVRETVGWSLATELPADRDPPLGQQTENWEWTLGQGLLYPHSCIASRSNLYSASMGCRNSFPAAPVTDHIGHPDRGQKPGAHLDPILSQSDDPTVRGIT